MSTPKSKKPKRFTNSQIHTGPAPFEKGVLGLNNPEYALRLAQITSEFEHLEGHMGLVLSMLLDNTDSRIGGYLLRSIKSQRGRYDVMRDLLEQAPWNAALGEEWDVLLDFYWKAGRMRNTYVHGRWYTEKGANQAVVFAPVDEHGMAIMTAKPIATKVLDAVLSHLRATTVMVFSVTGAEFRKRKGIQLPEELIPPVAMVTTHPKAPRSKLPKRKRKADRKALLKKRGLRK